MSSPATSPSPSSADSEQKLEAKGHPVEGADPKKKLEEEKLALEIKQLQRAWYQKPEYLSSAITLALGLGTLSLAINSGVFETNSKVLDWKTKELESRRNLVQFEVEQLDARKSALNIQNEQLTEENKELKEGSAALTKKNDELKKQGETFESSIVTLRGQKAKLETDVRLAEIKARVEQLKLFMPSIGDRNLARLSELTGSGKLGSAERAYFESVVASVSTRDDVKASICWLLFQGTHEEKWRRLLVVAATKDIIQNPALGSNAPVVYSGIFSDPVLDWPLYLISRVALPDERLELLKAAHHRLENRLSRSFVPEGALLEPLLPYGYAFESWIVSCRNTLDYHLAKWDASATIEYPAFWFDVTGFILKNSDFPRKPWKPGTKEIMNKLRPGTAQIPATLAELSPQAAAILSLKLILRDESNADWDIQFDESACGSLSGFPFKCQVNPSRPGMSGRFPPEPMHLALMRTERDAYNSWLSSHPKLVQFFTDPNLKSLSVAPRAILEKVIKKEWIEEGDLPADSP